MTDKEYIGVTANQLAKIASDLKAENAKLREQIHWLERGDIMHVLTDQEYIDQCERERLMQVSIDALDTENAKLREYAELYVGAVKAGGCDLCPYCDDFETCKDAEVDPMSEGCALYMELRELGIEVGE